MNRRALQTSNQHLLALAAKTCQAEMDSLKKSVEIDWLVRELVKLFVKLKPNEAEKVFGLDFRAANARELLGDIRLLVEFLVFENEVLVEINERLTQSNEDLSHRVKNLKGLIKHLRER